MFSINKYLIVNLVFPTSFLEREFLLSVMHVIRWSLYFIFLNIFFLIACLYLCILEPLQKLRVRLWPCKIDLNPPVTLCY